MELAGDDGDEATSGMGGVSVCVCELSAGDGVPMAEVGMLESAALCGRLSTRFISVLIVGAQ